MSLLPYLQMTPSGFRSHFLSFKAIHPPVDPPMVDVYHHETPESLPRLLLSLPEGVHIGHVSVPVNVFTVQGIFDNFTRLWKPVKLDDESFAELDKLRMQAVTVNDVPRLGGHMYLRNDQGILYVYWQVEGESHPLLRSAV